MDNCYAEKKHSQMVSRMRVSLLCTHIFDYPRKRIDGHDSRCDAYQKCADKCKLEYTCEQKI